MIKLLVGHKGTGKTKLMVEDANREYGRKETAVWYLSLRMTD